jgi:hypothetical protein
VAAGARAARVLGEGPRGCGGGFIGGSESSCARGPCWGGRPEAKTAAARAESVSDSAGGGG